MLGSGLPVRAQPGELLRKSHRPRLADATAPGSRSAMSRQSLRAIAPADIGHQLGRQRLFGWLAAAGAAVGWLGETLLASRHSRQIVVAAVD